MNTTHNYSGPIATPPRQRPRITGRRQRRGVTALLAMLYLVLIATLAIGFYGATTTQSQIASSEEKVARSYMAADSGLDFMRRVLAKVDITPHAGDPAYPSEKPAIDQLEDNLSGKLGTDKACCINGTGNLYNGANNLKRVGNVIYIPGDQTKPIKLDANGTSGFTATITDWAGEIVCKVQGNYSGATLSRSISLDFTRKPHESNIYDYAVASKGQIAILKGDITSTAGVPTTIAQMMSAQDTSPSLVMTGGSVGGNLTYLSDGGGASISGRVSVNGLTDPISIMNQLGKADEAPSFPVLSPTDFKSYATNNYVKNQNVQQNIIIKAGTGTPSSPVQFNANDKVQGIMYIETPNNVVFNGDFKLQGFIVMEAAADPATSKDSLTFSGNLTMSPVPSGSQFDALRATSGIAIMAPTADINMTGSSGGNIKGNIFADTFTFKGAAQLSIDLGSIITYNTGPGAFTMNSAKSIQFSATGAMNQPSKGAYYDTYYQPKAGSYQEVMP
jgi:hypothetical protein